MQLDQARIAIRERSWSEMLDLALHVARRHVRVILACCLASILPVAILNHLLVFGVPTSEWSDDVQSELYFPLLFLVLFETPLVTAPLTVYLGRALFEDRPQAADLVRQMLSSLPQLLIFQLLLRGVLFLAIVTAVIPYALWPYLNEVILLERNPMTSRRRRVTTWSRAVLLHRGSSADYLARALFAACISALSILALLGSFDFIWQNVIGSPPSATLQAVLVQASAWIVVVYSTVVRFLCYLDQRIRNEGWEIELLLRAQREQLLR